jgi:hypothetical protein
MELDLEHNPTIKDVQDEVCRLYNEGSPTSQFEIIYSDEHETDVDGFKYEFRTGSTTPYDAEFATPKVRHLKENVMENGELQEQYTTWQYYVSANFSKTHDSSENNSIDLIVGRNPIPRNTTGGIIQPPFYDTRLNSDLPTEIDGYELKSYNIIWRLLTIGSDPESTNSVQALIKERRRRRTSGRIV